MSERTLHHDPHLSRVVERQMRNWEISRSQSEKCAKKGVRPVCDFITMANNIGGGGGEIGARVAERLGWPIFDRDLLRSMAADDEVRIRLFRNMDERDAGWIEETFRTLIHGDFARNDYFHRLSETILALARQGPAVFVGRAADLILPKDRGLRVKVHANLESRIASFAKHGNLDPREAGRQIHKIERERANFIWQRFSMDMNDVSRFDLLINLDRVSEDDAVTLILRAAELRGLGA